jgi:hypothetical protein
VHHHQARRAGAQEGDAAGGERFCAAVVVYR